MTTLVKRLDYYWLGRLDESGRPFPAGNFGLDSEYDWFRENGKRCAFPGPPRVKLPIVEDVVNPTPFRPLFGFHTPPCDELTVFLVSAFGQDLPTNAPATLTFKLLLKVGIAFKCEDAAKATVTLPTIVDGGMIFIARGLSFVACELWGYVPEAIATNVPLSIVMRFIAANKGACCTPDTTYGEIAKALA